VDWGVLLSVPLESVVVRVVLAATAAVVLVRLLLRSGLRSPQARVVSALAPAAALLAIVVLTGTSLQLPLLMIPSEGVDAVTIPVQDGYLNFVPAAVPVLIGLWLSITAVRLVRRLLAVTRLRRQAAAWAQACDPPPRVRQIAVRVASALGVPIPRLAVRPTCPGGAYVVGTRRPIVVLGADLLAQLDEQEIEGVFAHELAHVRRRDTLVATLLGTLRDVTFFVPGGGWAVRQLHRERELAADQLAVAATKRPGALASGLLKVLEAAPSKTHACAALVPSGDLVGRVRVLVEDRPPATRLRRASEHVLVIGVVATATVGALIVPAMVSGGDQQRDALAFVWSNTQPLAVAEVPTGEARAFDVYRRANLDTSSRSASLAPRLDEQLQENRRAVWHACESDGCPMTDHIVGLQLQPSVRAVDAATRDRWDVTPVGGGAQPADGFRVFWLTLRAE
jgi:Zn-dependent protease with chaperone function